MDEEYEGNGYKPFTPELLWKIYLEVDFLLNQIFHVFYMIWNANVMMSELYIRCQNTLSLQKIEEIQK